MFELEVYRCRFFQELVFFVWAGYFFSFRSGLHVEVPKMSDFNVRKMLIGFNFLPISQSEIFAEFLTFSMIISYYSAISSSEKTQHF